MFINILKILPIIGHSIGIVFYLFKDKEKGDTFVKSSSRTRLMALQINDSFVILISSRCISIGFLLDYVNSFQKTSKGVDEFQ